jgi:hypothetical protein
MASGEGSFGGSRYGQGGMSGQGGFGQQGYQGSGGFGGGQPTSGGQGHGSHQGGYQGFAQGGQMGQGGFGQHHDEHYHSLRNRHIEQFDREYDEYRRHRQDRTANEFEEWRRTRSQGQQGGGILAGIGAAITNVVDQVTGGGRVDPSQIREHMPVLGSDGSHVGTIDHLEGNRLKLARNDPSAGGQHHYIDLDQVQSVDDGRVRLRMPADEARRSWQTEHGQAGGASGGQSGMSSSPTGASGVSTTQGGAGTVGITGAAADDAGSASIPKRSGSADKSSDMR